jgi:hypothetical protein
MVMSSKKIGKMVDTDVDKALANIGANAPKLDMKADDTVKSAAAPSRDMTRGEAFRYARMAAKAAGLDPSKQTFEYKGKTYNTRMAGEGVKRPAAPAAGRSSTGSSTATRTPTATATPPKSDVSGRTKEFFKNLPTMRASSTGRSGTGTSAPAANRTPPAGFKADARFLGAKIAPPPPPKKKDDFTSRLESKGAPKSQPTRAERMAAERAKNVAAYQAKKKAEADKERADKAKREGELKRGFRAATQGRNPLESVAKKAAGGKIDGCAVRGKTRAMKKGK